MSNRLFHADPPVRNVGGGLRDRRHIPGYRYTLCGVELPVAAVPAGDRPPGEGRRRGCRNSYAIRAGIIHVATCSDRMGSAAARSLSPDVTGVAFHYSRRAGHDALCLSQGTSIHDAPGIITRSVFGAYGKFILY